MSSLPAGSLKDSEKRAPRRMKGIGFEVEEMMKLFLVIIIGLGVVILIIAASGGLSALLTEFCARNPQICGGINPNQAADYETAKASVDSLVCAINSVAKGENLCTQYSTASLTPTGIQGFAIGSNINPSVRCENKNVVTQQVKPQEIPISYNAELTNSNYFGCTPISGGYKCFTCNSGKLVPVQYNTIDAVFVKRLTMADGQQMSNYFYCNPFIDTDGREYYDCYDCKSGRRTEIQGEKKCQVIISGKCEISSTSNYVCTVSDFQLPQKVDKMWIMTYGDPKFITYWQVFPMQQNTWTFKVDARIHAAIIFATALPPTKIVGTFAQVAFKHISVSAFNKLTGKVITEATKKTISDEFSKEIYQYAFKRATEQKLKALVKGVTLEGSALALEYVRSISAKYIPDENSFILKSPYQDKEPFKLVSELDGKPVFIEWKLSALSVGSSMTDTAHLVSPCKIDSMEVKKMAVVCNQYVKNAKTGIIDCVSPVKLEKNGVLSYIKSIFSSGTEPSCDISNYIYIPSKETEFINNIDRMKSTSAKTLGQELFGSQFSFSKCAEESSTDPGDILINQDYLDYIERTAKKEKTTIEGYKYSISGCDENEDKIPDKIEIDYQGKQQLIMDSDYDGFFDSYALKGCTTDAVIISNLKKTAVSNDYNYCNHANGQYGNYLQWAGYGLSITSAIVAAFVPGAQIYSISVGVAAIASTSAAIAGEYDQYKEGWPGKLGA
jgi:hypothetical protein